MMIPQNYSHLEFSDYVRLEQSEGRVRFSRGLNLDSGFEWDNPGARIRFRTNAKSIRARLFYSGRHTRLDALNGIGVYLVDSAIRCYYESTERPGEMTLEIEAIADGEFHLYEILLPLGDAVEFHGLETNVDACFARVPPRPSVRYVAYGDSITHGFRASDVTRNYPSQVGVSKNWEVVNLGFGSRQATPEDGMLIAEQQPSIASILIGANDGLHDKLIVQFKKDVAGIIKNARTAGTEFPIYLITPLTVPDGGWENVEVKYEPLREALRELVSESDDAKLKLIEGPSLIPADLSYFQDGLHPNDAGFKSMANRLVDVLNV